MKNRIQPYMKSGLSCLLLLLSLNFQANTKRADKAYDNYSFDNAAKRLSKQKNLSVEEQRKLAESLYNLNKYEDAAKAYESFVFTNDATTKDLFTYSLLLKTLGRYNEVSRYMERIQKTNNNDLRAKSFFQTQSTFNNLLKNDERYIIDTLDFNNDNDDFGTAFSKDGITFASTRTKNEITLRRYNWNRKPYLNILYADVNGDGQFSHIRILNRKFSKKWHEGPASFSGEDTLMAFTRNNYVSKATDGVVRLQIYFSHKQTDGKWSEPEPFYLNSADYSVGHPWLSTNGDTLYFASDMPGGIGGSDIYYCQRSQNGQWGIPHNVGKKVNTEGNELFPFVDEANKRLYFASNGLSGLGGLDIFVADYKNGEFTTPRNIGAPINSPYDDFAYIINSSNSFGFFSSNRPSGKGGDDIYHFLFRKGKQKEQEQKRKSYKYKVLVLNAETNNPIESADIKLGNAINMQTDSKGWCSHSFNSKINFDVNVSAVGYQEKSYKLNLDNNFENDSVKRDTVRLEIGRRIILYNIYYDFDKSDILPESEVALDMVVRFMNDNPNVKIELGSHTDSRGSDIYNMGLSERRARSAVNYLISQGIAADRITAKGYGETQLLNKCDDGVDCTEEEHRQNRRTEITITKYGKAEYIKQTKGKR